MSNVSTSIASVLSTTLEDLTSRITTPQSLPISSQSPSTSVNTTDISGVCVVERNWYTLGFQVIVLPSIFINVVTMAAALIDRRKLQRENCLFASVISTIASNNVYLFMLEWILFDNYWDPETAPKQTGLTLNKMLWVFLEAFSTALPFLICGNIVCLTYVTVHSASYVGRVARVEDKETARKRFLRIRKVTSGLLVTSWLVPLFLTVLAMTVMNCAAFCVCPTTNYEGDLCPNQEHCSRFWAPVTNSYLWLNVGLWTIAIISLCIQLWRSISQYQETTRRPSVHLQGLETLRDVIDPEQNPTGLAITRQSSRDASTGESDVTHIVEWTSQDVEITRGKVESNGVATTRNGNNNAPNAPQMRTKRPLTRQNTKMSFRDRLNPRLYFALILSAIYIACSACFVAAIIIDSVIGPVGVVSGYMVFALSRITMWLYTTACPIVMVRNLPSLKKSLDKLYHRVTHCQSRPSPKRHSLT